MKSNKKRAEARKLGPNMKKILKHSEGVLLKRGEWEKNRPVHMGVQKSKHTSTRLVAKKKNADEHEEVYKAMVVRSSEGATDVQIAREFGLSVGQVQLAMKHKFANGKKGADILRSLLLENAITIGVQANAKRRDLNGMQSAVATGIMTSNFIALDKHLATKPQTVDVEGLSEMGKQLGDITKVIKSAGFDVGPEADEIEDDEDDDDDE